MYDVRAGAAQYMAVPAFLMFSSKENLIYRGVWCVFHFFFVILTLSKFLDEPSEQVRVLTLENTNKN